MLFNSYIFIFAFLPIILAIYYFLQSRSRDNLSVATLVAASFIFYGYWDWRYLPLLFASLIVNQLFARALKGAPPERRTHRLRILTAGIVFNLGLLGFFKYSNFFVENVESALGVWVDFPYIVLPIGISFYTFQQIAYLVDHYRHRHSHDDFLRYALFVTFFPQLIAGPIVHHAEMMPQFRGDKLRRLGENLAVGVSVFALGLAKKVVLADSFSLGSTPIFDAAQIGHDPTFFEAWSAALCYTLQIYFDFSGYSDMAIGLGRMFGINLPINFAAPYRATSITDFWRRWHITLSRFLRDYLYIPLGGNRVGPMRRHVNVFATMVLGGLWHGAGWTFLIWGAMHGIYIVLDHLWQTHSPFAATTPGPVRTMAARLFTLLLVVVAWVPFRAPGLDSMVAMYRGMVGLNGISLPKQADVLLPLLAPYGIVADGLNLGNAWLGLVIAPATLALLLFLPDTHELFARYRVGLPTRGYPATRPVVSRRRWQWRPSPRYAVATGLLAALAVVMIQRGGEFIYFQF